MRILVVDDERDIGEMLGVVLGAEGWLVEQAADGEQALELVRRAEPDVLILDHNMPRRTGLDVAEELVDSGFTAPIILFSAYLDHGTRARCAEAGIAAVDKLDWPELVQSCRRISEKRAA